MEVNTKFIEDLESYNPISIGALASSTSKIIECNTTTLKAKKHDLLRLYKRVRRCILVYHLFSYYVKTLDCGY